ncbi:MAG: glycosyltransferase family 4 protein [Fusobacterium sp. JB021]|nr:glycosyltransferase family 4 protein [Fusobacterium sp. JB021]
MVEKIMLSSNTLYSLYNFRYNLLEKLKEKGYEVVCLGENDEFKKRLEDRGFRTINLEINKRGTNPFGDLSLLMEFIKIYRKEKPDCIFHYTIKPNIYGTIAAKILRIPTVNNVTGLGYMFGKKSLTNIIVKILYKIAFKFPEKVFFQNEDDMKLFLENKLIERKICGRLPGSGIDLEKFKPTEKVKKNEKVIFLFLGRIVDNKGVRILNEVSKEIFKKYKNVEFRLFGKINKEERGYVSEEEMKSWENKSNIKYCGNSKDVREQIQDSDCIILPSYYREGVPHSLLESAAMGKPIITTNNVGCKDIVEHGYNGFLSEIKDVQGMVKNIEKFLKLSNEEKGKLGINGRRKGEKEFDVNIVVNRYLETIK